MIELIHEYTSLPNLHPALVHFPLALLPTGLVFEAVLLVRRSDRRWLDKATAALYAGAALGAAVTYWAGRQAADSLLGLEPTVQARINDHSDWALRTVWVVVLLVAARVWVTSWDRKLNRRAPRAVLFVAMVGAVLLLVYTADLGGALVYEHGVAVQGRNASDAAPKEDLEEDEAASPSLDQAAESDPLARVVTEPDGTLQWRPLVSDSKALGTVLRPAPGASLEAVTWVEPGSNSKGLSLRVNGEAFALLPGSFGDVQVEAELDLDSFTGEVSLLHHARGIDRFGFLTIATSSDEFVLGTSDGQPRVLDRADRELPEGPLHFAVSAIGRHLKGYFANETVVHGHEPALGDGSCGLLFRGQGTVRVLSVTISPVEG